MGRVQIADALSAALLSLVDNHRYLLEVNANERSISHQLATYLAQHFSNYHVDCEYNRDGFDVKRLALEQRCTTDEDENAVTVFPDVVVHQRGSNENNLLVVEMKKASSGRYIEYDIQKLAAFRRQLNYQHAALVIVGDGDPKRPPFEISWVDG